MNIFGKRSSEYPKVPEGDVDIVLRCSICNGEQVICVRDKDGGKLRELMLVRSADDLTGFCSANRIDPMTIEKIY